MKIPTLNNEAQQAVEADERPREKISLRMLNELKFFEVEGDDRVFVTFPVFDQNDDLMRKETWPIKSNRFKRLLSKLLYLKSGKAPSINVINKTILMLEAEAYGVDGHVKVSQKWS